MHFVSEYTLQRIKLRENTQNLSHYRVAEILKGYQWEPHIRSVLVRILGLPARESLLYYVDSTLRPIWVMRGHQSAFDFITCFRAWCSGFP
jgi:hypothetical protein